MPPTSAALPPSTYSYSYSLPTSSSSPWLPSPPSPRVLSVRLLGLPSLPIAFHPLPRITAVTSSPLRPSPRMLAHPSTRRPTHPPGRKSTRSSARRTRRSPFARRTAAASSVTARSSAVSSPMSTSARRGPRRMPTIRSRSSRSPLLPSSLPCYRATVLPCYRATVLAPCSRHCLPCEAGADPYPARVVQLTSALPPPGHLTVGLPRLDHGVGRLGALSSPPPLHTPRWRRAWGRAARGRCPRIHITGAGPRVTGLLAGWPARLPAHLTASPPRARLTAPAP